MAMTQGELAKALITIGGVVLIIGFLLGATSACVRGRNPTNGTEVPVCSGPDLPVLYSSTGLGLVLLVGGLILFRNAAKTT
jgi:hypothetical protein